MTKISVVYTAVGHHTVSPSFEHEPSSLGPSWRWLDVQVKFSIVGSLLSGTLSHRNNLGKERTSEILPVPG